MVRTIIAVVTLMLAASDASGQSVIYEFRPGGTPPMMSNPYATPYPVWQNGSAPSSPVAMPRPPSLPAPPQVHSYVPTPPPVGNRQSTLPAPPPPAGSY